MTKDSIDITFVTHSTTLDNQAKLASGWFDVELSELGKLQAQELGLRQKETDYDAIFTSDLRRTIDTAKIAFNGGNIPIFQDKRLRECDYGDLTLAQNATIENIKLSHLNFPFPNGESYTQTNARMRDFLNDLLQNYLGCRILIVGHRATHYALDSLINHIPIERLLTEKFIWQPAFYYELGDFLKGDEHE